MKTPKILLVAELSANHNQNKDLALQTILAAKQSGANAIKLQTYTPDCLTLDSDKEYFKIKGTLWEGKNLYQLYKEAMTPWEWHKELFEYAKSLGLICFSSPFSIEAVEFLETLDNPIYKVASFEVLDLELVYAMAKTQKPIVLSKGIATFKELQEAIEVCKMAGNNDITLLQCTSAYPAPLKDANLSLIPKMQQDFKVKVGLSDHTLGITAPIVAVSLGAVMVEKHFILNRSLGGVDSAFSLEPQEFLEMTKCIAETQKLLGTPTYELSSKSKEGRAFGRSLFISQNIKKGETFTRDNVKSIRPGYGIPPKYLKEILGKQALKDLERGEPLKWEYFS